MRDLPDNDEWILERRRAIGSRVREERIRQNLTQEQLILAAGLDRVTLWRVESGEETTLSTLMRLAWVLDVPLAALCDGPPPPRG